MCVLGNSLGQDMKKIGTSIWNGNQFLTCKNVITEVEFGSSKTFKWPECSRLYFHSC